MKRNKGPSRRIKKGNRRARTRNKNKNTPAFSPVSPEQPPHIFIYPSVPAAVNDFKRMTVDAGIDYEICATITPDHFTDSWALKLHHRGLPSARTGRHSCTFEKYERIILHNHPDKYFPSVEDIEKVVKNHKPNMVIRESYIACNFGVWRFVIEPSNKLSDEILLSIRDEAKLSLDDFYISTGRGRSYNQEAVDFLCREIREIYGIRVYFYPGNSYQETDEASLN